MYKVDKNKCSEFDNCKTVKCVNGQTVCAGCGTVVRKENEVKR